MVDSILNTRSLSDHPNFQIKNALRCNLVKRYGQVTP
jgi:hypothetical protein